MTEEDRKKSAKGLRAGPDKSHDGVKGINKVVSDKSLNEIQEALMGPLKPLEGAFNSLKELSSKTSDKKVPCLLRCGATVKQSAWPSREDITLYNCGECGGYGVAGPLEAVWDDGRADQVAALKDEFLRLRAKLKTKVGVFYSDGNNSVVKLRFTSA